MATFSVDITSVLFAGYRPAFKDITISNMPAAGVSCSIIGTDSSSFDFRLPGSETNIYRVYTTARHYGTTYNVASKTAVFRITNSSDSSDYVDVNLEEEYCNTSDITILPQDSTSDHIYTVHTGAYPNYYKDCVFFDYTDVMGESVPVYVDGPYSSITVSDTTWCDYVTETPYYTDTGFERVRFTCISNFETYRYCTYKFDTSSTTFYIFQNAYPSSSNHYGCTSSISFPYTGGTQRGTLYTATSTNINNLTFWSDLTENGFSNLSVSKVGSSIQRRGEAYYDITVGANSGGALKGIFIYKSTSGGWSGGFRGFSIVRQDATPSLVVRPAWLDYTAAGGSQTLDVTYATSLTTNMGSLPSWLTSSYVQGSGDSRTYTVTAASNTGSSTRTFDLTFADVNMSLSIPVWQDAPLPYLSISPSSDTVSGSSGTVQITVHSSGISSISYSISGNWISYVSESSGVYTFSYTQNTSTSAGRQGTIVFSGGGFSETYTLSQSARMSVDPQEVSVGYRGGSYTATVYNAPQGGLYLDTVSSDSWISSSISGSTISMTVQANTGAARVGYVTYRSYDDYNYAVTVTVRQDEVGQPLEVDPSQLYFSKNGGTGTVTVSHIPSGGVDIWDGSWTWCSLTGNTLSIECSANTGTNNRSWNVTLVDREDSTNRAVVNVVQFGTDAPGISTNKDALYFTYNLTEDVQDVVVYSTIPVTYSLGAYATVRNVEAISGGYVYSIYMEPSTSSLTPSRSSYITFTGAVGDTVTVNLYSNYPYWEPSELVFYKQGGTKEALCDHPADSSSSGPSDPPFTATRNRLSATLSKYSITCSPNTTNTTRESSIVMSFGQGISGYIHLIQYPYNKLTVTPESALIGAEGGSVDVTVIYRESVQMNTASFPDWLSYTVVSTGDETVVYRFSIAENRSPDVRSFNVVIEDIVDDFVFPVYQEGAGCTFDVYPKVLVFRKEGESIVLQIDDLPENGVIYQIEYDGDGGWLSVNNNTVTAAENTGFERTARIKVSNYDDPDDYMYLSVRQEGIETIDYDLRINGTSVDFKADEVCILFNKQRTDYTNPTIVKNSFTKTITLPGTSSNHRLFSSIWKLNRTQWQEAYNPSRRVPFILMKSGTLIEKGYVKLNNIIWNGDMFNYEITLYGELGNILYGLSYRIDPNTEESIPMTLGDLDFDFGYQGLNYSYGSYADNPSIDHTKFTICRDLIIQCWKQLSDGTGAEMGDMVNFMVSYDGVPSTENFDPKSVWCSVGNMYTPSGSDVQYGNRKAAVKWDNEGYPIGRFPAEVTKDNVTYRAFRTHIAQQDPDDSYGLLQLKDGVTPLEARDFRAYLLRPVVRIKAIFDAIDAYISRVYGYTLDLSDPFFSTDEFLDTWMSLSMLYEIDPYVQCGDVITKEQLFKNTGTPASYLISYAKIYGIYLDVDYKSKKFVLTRLPNFFDSVSSPSKYELVVDKGKEIKINPLSFDKAAYTFDYGDGEGEYIKKYKENYGIGYGSKKVNTGYRFDSSVAPYIDNNIYKGGVDTLEQSIYYRYPFTVKGSTLVCYPFALTDESRLPEYKLFNINNTTIEDTYGAEMKNVWKISIGTLRSDMSNTGYQFIDSRWIGLRKDIWQDGFPKLQFHSEDNKGADGKDVLVRFEGFKQVQYGFVYGADDYASDKISFNRESITDFEYVHYLISDDHPYLRNILGTNGYYDNPYPVEGYGYNYISVVDKLPMFSRCDYTLECDPDIYPKVLLNSFGDETMGYMGSADRVAHYQNFDTTVSSTLTQRQAVYVDMTGKIKNNHKYLLVSLVSTSNYNTIINNNSYIYPDIVGAQVVDKKELSYYAVPQLIGSIVDSGDTGSSLYQFVPLTTYSGDVRWRTYYMFMCDLTEAGLEDRITTVSEGISYFGLTEKKGGYSFDMKDTLDFGLAREIYIPSCTYEAGMGIYNKYWARYIADVYSVDTRVMECTCYLDNISDVFRKFYLYDDCLWILSKVTDWDMDTKKCKAVFIKVNDRDDYIS